MKAEELIGKSKDELKKMLLDLKKQQFNLRFQLSQGQLENTAQIRRTRRDVARVITFLNAGETSAPAPKPAKKAPAEKKETTAKKTTAKKSASKKKAA